LRIILNGCNFRSRKKKVVCWSELPSLGILSRKRELPILI
jgi:hypothetical protein